MTCHWWHAGFVSKTTSDSAPVSSSAAISTDDAGFPAPRAGTGERIKTLLILGASGDLTGRLLLPGVARLIAAGRAPGLELMGAGNDDWTPEQWQERLEQTFADALADDPASSKMGRADLRRIKSASSYHQVDVTAPGALGKLLADVPGPVALYFALPPAVSQKACETLQPEDVPAGTRLVMEKPFGSSAASAHALNNTLARLVPESHIHRIDHFLGKSTVLNVMGLRFANRLLEHSWNADHIEKVEIIFDEDLTLENRAGYYDHAGACRDMIQSHLLQIMAIMAMEPPATLDEQDVRSNIAAVLRASTVGPRGSKDLRNFARRARYTAGTIGDRSVPNYVDEDGVEPANNTETLAELEVFISNWRWAGVPFILRSGKALGQSRKEAVITFKPVPHLPAGFSGTDSPTRLHIGFGPATLRLDVDVNGPGDLFSLDRVHLEAALGSDPLLPYGEVLDGVLSADPLLSVRGDTAEECWRIVEPALEAWEKGQVPLEDYAAGSSGPSAWPSSRQDN